MRGPERGRVSSRLGRVWAPVAFVMLSAAPASNPASAQDCSVGRDGWDDIQRFRDCIEKNGLEAWSPWVLHQAAEYTTNPAIVRLLLQGGADPNAPDDNGLPPLHWGAENSNLAEGADPNDADHYGWGPLHFAVPLAGLRLCRCFWLWGQP